MIPTREVGGITGVIPTSLTHSDQLTFTLTFQVSWRSCAQQNPEPPGALPGRVLDSFLSGQLSLCGQRYLRLDLGFRSTSCRIEVGAVSYRFRLRPIN